MSLLVTGVDHHTAPVDLRERLSVERDELPKTLQQLSEYVPQSAILSTCNRTEVYVYDPEGQRLGERVSDFISEYSGVPRPELERYTYKWWDIDCVSHLFRVAAGLESMIVGERQILGQVRAAFSAAGQGEYMKSPLSRVFHSALRAGRRVHRETGIGQHSRSVSRAAVQMAREFSAIWRIVALWLSAPETPDGWLRGRCRTRECDTSELRTGPRGEPRK